MEACHCSMLWSTGTILGHLLSEFFFFFTWGIKLAPAMLIQLFYATKTNCNL